MTIIPHRVKRKGKEYYELIDVKRIGGKSVQKYVGYLGKDPKSKWRSHTATYCPMLTG